jgi:subtilisin family serine protease
MDPLELVRLPALMALTRGHGDVVIGLVDGPIALDHPGLAGAIIRTLPGLTAACHDAASEPCRHGTFVAGILVGDRDGRAPAIAPNCTILVRPVFLESGPAGEQASASPDELAEAITACINAGAWIINLSVALAGGSVAAHHELTEVLGHAARRGVLVMAAAGNQGALTGSTITSHPWTIPVAAYGGPGRPTAQSNLGRSTGSRGLGAPGEDVVSLASDGGSVAAGGTSVATPFVSGTAALLWSAFPGAVAVDVKQALRSSARGQRRAVAPPLLDALGAYELLSEGGARRAVP